MTTTSKYLKNDSMKVIENLDINWRGFVLFLFYLLICFWIFNHRGFGCKHSPHHPEKPYHRPGAGTSPPVVEFECVDKRQPWQAIAWHQKATSCNTIRTNLQTSSETSQESVGCTSCRPEDAPWWGSWPGLLGEEFGSCQVRTSTSWWVFQVELMIFFVFNLSALVLQYWNNLYICFVELF